MFRIDLVSYWFEPFALIPQISSSIPYPAFKGHSFWNLIPADMWAIPVIDCKATSAPLAQSASQAARHPPRLALPTVRKVSPISLFC
jgi:hypothetical protein